MKGTTLRVFIVVLASFVIFSLATSGPSSHLSEQDKADLKKILSASKSFTNIKSTYYTVASLKKLGAEIPDKSKHCESAKSAISNEIEGKKKAQTIFYAVATAETLGCGQNVGQNVVQELKKALASDSLENLYYGLSSVLTLRSHKHLDGIQDSDIFAAVEKITSMQEEDGTFTSEDDEATIYNAGLAFKVLTQVATEMKLSTDQRSNLEAVMDKARDFFKSQGTESDGVISFFDYDSKHSTLKTTSLVVKGLLSLASALNYQKISVKPDQLVAAAEYFVQKKFVAGSEDAFYVLEGLEALSQNNVGVPVVVSLGQGSISEKSDGNVAVHATTVLGTPVDARVVLARAYPDNKKDKILVTKQDVAGGKLNFLASKPDAGLYHLEFTATPSQKGFLAANNVVRTLKVTTTVNIVDVQVAVSDATNAAAGRKHTVEHPKTLTEVITVTEPQHLIVTFKVRSQGGKLVQVHQAFVRIYNAKAEQIVVAKFDGNQYAADINLSELELAGDDKYSLELIIGDAFVQNPSVWKFASANLKFTRPIAAREDPFAVKPEIKHTFSEPPKRPAATISFGFTVAAAAPLAFLLIGILAAGGNINNYPTSGLTPVYALAMQASLGAILALYALYWLALNMVQTLCYLTVLFVVFVFFATKTLNAMSLSSYGKAHTD